MAKILSQDEIDALLSSVSSGGGEEAISAAVAQSDEFLRPVVAYDFKHPNRVSKDQIRTLENMHDNFAGHFGSSLSAMTRALMDVELVSVDQITYSEFIMSLVSPSCTYTIAAKPLEGLAVVDFSPALTFAFVERMFGGSGKALETDRELTGIEKTVMNRIAAKLYLDLEKAWEHIVPIKIEQVSFESNPQFIQVVPPGETVVVVSFQLKLFKTSGLLSVCYPYMSLESIIQKLSAQNWIDATKRKNLEGDRECNVTNIYKVGAKVSASLGAAQIKIGEFLAIRAGDIITLDHRVSNPIGLYVEGRRKFDASPGLSGKKKACQIVAVVERP